MSADEYQPTGGRDTRRTATRRRRATPQAQGDEGRPGLVSEGQPGGAVVGSIIQLASLGAGTPCCVNLRNVTRLIEVEGGTEISFVGFEFDRSGHGTNPARVVVMEPADYIVSREVAGSFIRVTLARSHAPAFVNLSNVTDFQTVGSWTRIAFTAFGFDESDRAIDDHVVVLESPEEILRNIGQFQDVAS
jgi:hypothetical protein